MPAVVGLLHLKVHVPCALSLKDKRQVIKSFKDRLGHAFNVSVAEVDYLESHRMAMLAAAMVANDRAYIEGALQKIVNMASAHRDMILIESQIDWL